MPFESRLSIRVDHNLMATLDRIAPGKSKSAVMRDLTRLLANAIDAEGLRLGEVSSVHLAPAINAYIVSIEGGEK